MKFLIINSKKSIKDDQETIIDLLSKIVSLKDTKQLDDNNLVVFFDDDENIDFHDIILNINVDLYSDFRIYVSKTFENKNNLINRLNNVFIKLKEIPYDYKWVYLDDRQLLKFDLESNRKIEDIKKEVLKKYYNDQEMIKTIKTYLESNQNMSLAAKKLYLHRNTLIQRIERFNDETGLDVKLFIDGYLIYHLL